MINNMLSNVKSHLILVNFFRDPISFPPVLLRY